MRRVPVLLLVLCLQCLAGSAARAEAWRPGQRIVTYAIDGATGIALYRSIGERGPQLAGRRVIAHTHYELLWTRRYRPRPDGSCILAVAVPHLTVVTTLPKAPARLSPAVAASWHRFITGITEHERFHGNEIVAMVRRIEAFSVGLSAPSDPGCRTVRARLQAYVIETVADHEAASRAFDKTEWGEGGAMRKLVLELVNGP